MPGKVLTFLGLLGMAGCVRHPKTAKDALELSESQAGKPSCFRPLGLGRALLSKLVMTSAQKLSAPCFSLACCSGHKLSSPELSLRVYHHHSVEIDRLKIIRNYSLGIS